MATNNVYHITLPRVVNYSCTGYIRLATECGCYIKACIDPFQLNSRSLSLCSLKIISMDLQESAYYKR